MSEVALRGERSAAPRDFVDRIYSSPFERTKFSENRKEQSAFDAARHLLRPEEVTTHPHSFTEDNCEVAALLGNLRVALREFCLFDTENAQNSSFASQHLTLYLVLSGSAEVIVNGNLHQFDAGTVILVPRDFVLSMQAIRHRKSGLTVSRAELTANLGPGFSFFDMLKQPLVNRDDSKFVHTIMTDVFDELIACNLGARPIAESVLAIMLIRIVRRSIAEKPLTDPIRMILTQPDIARVLNAITNNPERRYSVQSLADIARQTPLQLAHKFNEIFGQTPSDYLKCVRLKLAEKLLTETNLPIKTIAGNVGFASRSHFSRIFRDHSGLDPTEFRQRITASG